MSINRFDSAQALQPLKAFQRRTVDYVFDRLYNGPNPTTRFLVADEVGLGKTMVARGVIARTIEHLWDTTARIDILYICSNQAIAAQNINRLNVLGRKELALPTRMTLVPLQLRGDEGLNANKVNFISLTPGTTFDLRSSTGVVQERALILRLLEGVVSNPRGLRNLLQVTAGLDGWQQEADEMSLEGIDPLIQQRFQKSVRTNNSLFDELENVCEMFGRRRDAYPLKMSQPRNALVGRLRAALSHICVEALEPDLIIMDEFQRFRELLHGDSDPGLLARELFSYTDPSGHCARTLLLSATPYRMLTLSGDDPEEGDHYKDFLEIISFLYGSEDGPKMAESLRYEMEELRSLLQGLPATRTAANSAREKIENRLRKVMVRTERVSSTIERDSMIKEVPMPLSVEPTDLCHASLVSKVAKLLDAPEIIEYWKSAPYLLNFMRDYALKNLLKDAAERPPPGLIEAIQKGKTALLNRADIDAYRPLNAANGRMRGIMHDVFPPALEANLWIPPSLPYYGPAPAEPRLTKSLIFSSWSIVPDAISALLSYEAERRMGVGEQGHNYFDPVRPRPLQFRQDQGRLAGMRAMLLIYPAAKLAEVGDPLDIFAERKERLPTSEMKAAVATRLRSLIAELNLSTPGDDQTKSWEWSSPVTIDSISGLKTSDWLTSTTGLEAMAAEDAFTDHVKELRSAIGRQDLGPADENVISLLVDVALGSPAVCALRALRRIASELAWDNPALLQAAARVAFGFRTLFNQHDAVALLRRGDDNAYWQRVLTFSIDRNLQAVLDEYSHYLVDAEGLGAHPPEDRVKGVADAMVSALSVRPSQIEVDEPSVENGELTVGKFHMRGRFAMRLGDYVDEEGAAARLGSVRDAFNSPFRPFVLATTSIGQEGLDFHPYCYRIYHWNLPTNPVDLEQREGRIHRFKSHAVRLNVAHQSKEFLLTTGVSGPDPWQVMFDAAREQSWAQRDMIPYWIFEGPVKVERRVPILPFSREKKRLEWLKRSLTVYRLAFGQPRQEDLLKYLESLLEGPLTAEELSSLQISLEPQEILAV